MNQVNERTWVALMSSMVTLPPGAVATGTSASARSRPKRHHQEKLRSTVRSVMGDSDAESPASTESLTVDGPPTWLHTWGAPASSTKHGCWLSVEVTFEVAK